VHDSGVGFTYSLTFSCAEYKSPDTASFLKSVNNVSSNYDIGKLCTEDPISVSIKFYKKFHAFFNTVLMKGGPRQGRPLLLEERVPSTWSSTLPCPIVDLRCTSYQSG